MARAQQLAINRAGEGFLRDLRVAVFDRLQAQSMAFFDRNKAGVLVARMTADIESMGELIQWGLLQFVGAGLLLLMTLILMTALSWQMTLIVVLFVAPVLGVAAIRFQRLSNVAYLDVRERVGSNLSNLRRECPMPTFILLLHEPPDAFPPDISPDQIQAIIQRYIAWRMKVRRAPYAH